MKHFFRFFGLLIFIFLLSSCTTDGNTTNVSSLTINLSALPKKVNVENFDLELIKLTIVYQDGQTKEDVLKESMIDKESLDKLQHPGEHTINFTYENYKSSFNIKLLPITYIVVFYDIDGNVISEQVVSKGENANVPTYPNIEGFEYIGLSSNDYLNVSKDVNIYPIYNILNPSAALEEVGQYLYYKYNNFKVNQDLELETKVNHINVEWESLNDHLDNSGTFDRPYVAKTLKMKVKVSYGEHSITKELNLISDGYKNIDSNIASGYVYRNYYSLNEQFFEAIDIVYCAFLMFNSDGSLADNGYVLASVKNNISKRANENGVYVVISLGGGGDDPTRIFSEVCRNPEARSTLINNIIDVINEYGFDGVDIDWETPSYSERTIFTQFAKELNEAVKQNNPHHLVTAAIGGGMWQPSCYDLANSEKYLDFINVMTYSMSSSSGTYQNALFKSTSYHNSSLKVGRTLNSCSIEESIAIYNDLGVANNKLIFGLAFYGIVQTNSNGRWSRSQNVDYTQIVNKYLTSSEYTYAYDEKAQVPYIIKNDGTIFISYDDPTSIKAKAAYMKEMGCAGLMYWENGCDSTGELIKAMQEGLK